MNKNKLLSVVLVFCTSKFIFAETPVSPNQVVDAMEATGKHPGFRRNHAKGICIEGHFKGSKEAQALSKSFLFSGKEIPFIGRFSNPGSDPQSNDKSMMPRGLALQFKGPKNQVSNMSMINAPVFAVSTPEGFFELLHLKTPADIAAFQKKYPQSAKFFEFVGGHPAPESFATENYHSLHAFKFTNSSGKSQYVRWNFIAQAGEKFLSEAELKSKDKDFLFQEFIQRAPSRPTWTMDAVLAEGDDTLTDPSQEWPATRKKISLGTLTVFSANENGTCVGINFDPNRLAEGIAPSDDPVLKFRSPAYAISYGKRVSEAQSKTK